MRRPKFLEGLTGAEYVEVYERCRRADVRIKSPNILPQVIKAVGNTLKHLARLAVYFVDYTWTVPPKKGSKYNYVVLLHEYYVEEAHAGLNTTPSKRPAATDISDDDDDGAIVPAVYTTNDAVRAMQDRKISKVADEHIEKYQRVLTFLSELMDHVAKNKKSWDEIYKVGCRLPIRDSTIVGSRTFLFR